MECRLYSCSNNEHQICIPDRKKFILGRGPLTKIKEKKCSRKQVEITADYDSKEIEVKQIGRNPSGIGSSLLKQGDVHLLGPGSVFSFLPGKHSFIVQFFDSNNSPSHESNSKKNSSCKGIKDKFQTLKRTLSKELLINAMKPSPGKSDTSADSATTITGDVDESLDNLESPAEAADPSLQTMNLEKESESPNRDVTKGSNEKKRKRGSTYKDKNIGGVPSKLRKSLSGKLISCVSSEDKEKVDFEDLREEFGDAIIQEIEKEQELSEESSVCSSSKEKQHNSFPSGKVESEQSCKVKENTWISKDSLMIFSGKNLKCKEKIASFDLDGTIICTKSGKVFPTNADDWKLLFGNIKSKLKQLHDSDFKIVIFTNQKGLGNYQVSVEGFKQKIEKIQEAVGVPLQCFVAKGDDQFRKPVTGMWLELCTNHNGSEHIDVAKSFYVGDAAGRPANWTKGRKKDFSCADRCFAANVGLTFHTPEEFFLNWGKSPFSWPVFTPSSLKKAISLLHADSANSELRKKTQEIIVMVGFPACGKSTISRKHFVLHGYEHVNQDTLGTWQKCVAACKLAISQGKSVVIDNTNPNRKTRQRYIEVAKSEKIPARCFWMTTSHENSLHNNKFRDLTNTNKDYKHVGRIAFNIYKSSFEEPQLDEGFEDIVKLNFAPCFDDVEMEKLYFSYLL